ncbi:sulfatase [Hungatella sp.]|jgi:arylsulfatase A-like enzyme|uniref:sulfatase family protein n=1 Tax=Hungatella sp. TaxID=2613924 RepID=UPI002A7F6AE1|nr:sulfatase [Hungatella sp.]
MKKPNLLVVFADQWRNTARGLHNPQIATPNMDRFAEEAFSTDQAVSGCPLCSPYRSELLTGRRAVHTGVFGNCMTGYDMCLSPEELCISQVLKESGYRTGYIGKWHLDSPELNSGSQPLSGAEGWDAYTPPGKKRHGFEYWHAYNAWNDHLHMHYWEEDSEKIFTNLWSPVYETDKALEFMERRKKEPFALFLSWNPPHPPFEKIPEKYYDLYRDLEPDYSPNVEGDRFDNQTGEPGFKSRKELDEAIRCYYAAVTGLDEQFGRIITWLKENELYDQTIVLLTADHGEHLGAHGYVGKHTWYEESINVPFMLSYPEKIPVGRNDISMETVDIFPTLLGLMDITIPPSVEGRCLADWLICGKRPENEAVYSSAYISRDIFLEAYREKGLDPKRSGWRCIRTPEYKYVIEKGYLPEDVPRYLLFNRKADPYEINPLISNSPWEHSLMAQMHRRLIKHLEETGDLIKLE